MMTTLPSDWTFYKEEQEQQKQHSQHLVAPASPTEMSSMGAVPSVVPLRVHLEQGLYQSSANSGETYAWKRNKSHPKSLPVNSNHHSLFLEQQQQQQPQSLLYPDQWSMGISAATPASTVWPVSNPPRTSSATSSAEASSQHSRTSIWAEDHSPESHHGSPGGANHKNTNMSNLNVFGYTLSASSNNKHNTIMMEDDEAEDEDGEFEIPGYSNPPGIESSFGQQYSVQSIRARRPFLQRRSIGPATEVMDCYTNNNGTASSFFETATIAGCQDFGSVGGLDFVSSAMSVDTNSTPGLLAIPSSSTTTTSASSAYSSSLFSSTDHYLGQQAQQEQHNQHHHHAQLNPPPGFVDGKSNNKYHHYPTRGGRQSGRKVRGRYNNNHNAGSSIPFPLGPLQESNLGLHPAPSLPTAARGGSAGSTYHTKTALPPRTSMDSGTSVTQDDSSSSSHQTLDISSSSEAIRQLMQPKVPSSASSSAARAASHAGLDPSSYHSYTERSEDFWSSRRLPTTLEGPMDFSSSSTHPILPLHVSEADDNSITFNDDEDEDFTFNEEDGFPLDPEDSWGDCKSCLSPPTSKKQEWLMRMNRKMQECPVGELDPAVIPLTAVMNGWAKAKSSQGAAKVEEWLQRAEQEFAAGNTQVVPTTKMYTVAVDAWARSGKGGAAAQRAETLLQQMYNMFKTGGNPALKPTTGIFNAVINAWARSMESVAPTRAEQILEWMENLTDLDVRPDKYTFNTVIHAYSKAGGKEAAVKAQDLLMRMQRMYEQGNALTKADTITYNCVINCWAKSGRGGEAAAEAEKLLNKMHHLYEMGDADVKPNVVTYGAVIDAFAKSGQRGAASKADGLLANMIRLHQSDPVKHADLMPNTYVFNTVINCWSKSKERDAASKAEEMLVAMGRLHASGMASLKPDAFTYTAVIDAWSKSFLRGAADRANLLLDKMEAKYQNGDHDLKPNTFTYNAVINALAKSCEAGAAARAERVLQNMVNRHRNNGGDDVKPTTINFNTVLDAWAKSGGGRAAAERAEEILEWMDRLCKQGNKDVAPDTISFNAVLDAWARSGDRNAPRRCEQILDHMDELFRAGNQGVKPDTYTYNTLINSWAKSSMSGAASRAEHVLQVMEKRWRDGDSDFKPNTRTYTSVIDAWAKSSERGAALRCESILNGMIRNYEANQDEDSRPNVHTANAVCNACAFSKHDDDRAEALQIAFRVFKWLLTQADMQPDSYTYTILLSVCANLIPRHETATRYAQARSFFESCRNAGYVNDYVLRKLRQTVTEEEYLVLVDYRADAPASGMPPSWSRNTKPDAPSKRKNKWNNNRRRG